MRLAAVTVGLALALSLALATPAAAQFSQFSWTLQNPNGGIGDLTDTSMGIYGLFAQQGSIVKYTTQSPVSGRVDVHSIVMPEDGVCSGGGSSALLIVGTSTGSYASCNFSGDLEFDVAEGQVFGFGLQTFNTSWPYGVDLTNFVFTPYWRNLANALAGGAGAPSLTGTGIVQPGQVIGLKLTNAAPSAPAALIIGFLPALVPFKGGVLVPTPDLLIAGLSTSPTGTLTLSSTLPNVPVGFKFLAQFWVADAGAPAGFAASNGLIGTRLP